MDPLSSMLLIVGYSLSIPLGGKIFSYLKNENRYATWGFQLGVLFATIGWAVKKSMILVAIHCFILVGIKGATFFISQMKKQKKL